MIMKERIREIVSPSQRHQGICQQLNAYLGYGVKQACLAMPTFKQVEVGYPEGISRRFDIGDTIPVGDLLPGFSLDAAAVLKD